MTDEAEHLCSRWFQLLPATLHVHFHLQRGLRALVMLLLQSLLLAWATCQESLVLPLWVNPFNALPILSASSLFFACFPPTLPSEEAVTLIRLTLLQARAAGGEQKAPPPPHRCLVPPPPPPPPPTEALGCNASPSESLRLTRALLLDYHPDSEMLLLFTGGHLSLPQQPVRSCLNHPEGWVGVRQGGSGYFLKLRCFPPPPAACWVLSPVLLCHLPVTGPAQPWKLRSI